MSNENKTIHDFELKLICDFFSNMERQGPGSPDVTLKALSFIDNLTDKSLIADIGCGTGGQTMVLAGHIPGQITGLDLFPDFIDIFNRNAKQAGLQDRVKGIVGSMDNLPKTIGLPFEGITNASSAPASIRSCAQRSAQASISSWCSGFALILGIRMRLNRSSSILDSFFEMYFCISFINIYNKVNYFNTLPLL